MANQPTLFPILEAPSSSPLARAAAGAPLHATGHLTEYRALHSRSILNKVSSRRGLPFSHGINPYRGCELGCRYCYARYTHEFLDNTPEEFEQRIYFKENAAWLLRQELAALRPGAEIALGTATDPYQPIERRLGITRSLLEVFASTRGLRLGIVTKSPLILRDLDLLLEIHARHHLSIAITVTTLDRRLARLLEPRAPRPELRIGAVARLRRAALVAGVLCSPVMPGITDSPESLRAVAGAAAGAGAAFFAAGALFLKPCSLPTFLSFLEKHLPGRLEAYRERYAGSAFLPGAYRRHLAGLVDSICRDAGLRGREGGDLASPAGSGAQSGPLSGSGSGSGSEAWLPF